MTHHFKVLELLSREHLDALETFAREPGRTINEVHQWMKDAGYAICRTACANWMTEFLGKSRMRPSPASPVVGILPASAAGLVDGSIQALFQHFFNDLLNRVTALSAENARLASKIAELERPSKHRRG